VGFVRNEQDILSRAFISGEAKATFRSRGQDYEVDFLRMLQRNAITGTSRSIRVLGAVKFQWGDMQQWNEFDGSVCDALVEANNAETAPDSVKFNADGIDYVANFRDMVQINVQTNMSRPIRVVPALTVLALTVGVSAPTAAANVQTGMYTMARMDSSEGKLLTIQGGQVQLAHRPSAAESVWRFVEGEPGVFSIGLANARSENVLRVEPKKKESVLSGGKPCTWLVRPDGASGFQIEHQLLKGVYLTTDAKDQLSLSGQPEKWFIKESASAQMSVGLQVRDYCDQLFDVRDNPSQFKSMYDDFKANLQSRRDPDERSVLESSVFEIMDGDTLRALMKTKDNVLWHNILEKTDRFIELLKEELAEETPIPPVGGASENVNFERARTKRVTIMDQTLRENATNTPCGHNAPLKYQSWKMVKAMGFNDVAVAGLYYGETYTPETQILEVLAREGEDMAGTFAMFAPAKPDRTKGLAAVRKYGVQNVFLDTSLVKSTRFADFDFRTVVMDALRDCQETLHGMGCSSTKDKRSIDENVRASGEVFINLVDLFEFLDWNGETQKPNDAKLDDFKNALKLWRSSPAFKDRVSAILFEEGRGLAHYEDHQEFARQLKEWIDDPKIVILGHAHAGKSNSHDAASSAMFKTGADGIWASLLPQSALSGHNSTTVFLAWLRDTARNVSAGRFRVGQLAIICRWLFYLNFNTLRIPDDCPIWGGREITPMLSAFDLRNGWRAKKAEGFYQSFRKERMAKIMEMEADLRELEFPDHASGKDFKPPARIGYRVAPTVSDPPIWHGYLVELGFENPPADPKNPNLDLTKRVQAVMLSTMNANIRINIDKKESVDTLVKIAKGLQTEGKKCPEVIQDWKVAIHSADRMH